MNKFKPQPEIKPLYMLTASLGMLIITLSGAGLLKMAGREEFISAASPYLLIMLFIAGIFIYWLSMVRAVNRSHHLTWNPQSVSWFLPGQQEPVTVSLADITHVAFTDKQIVISLLSGEIYHINRGRFFIKERREITERFERLLSVKHLNATDQAV
jgi:hypothetical protein